MIKTILTRHFNRDKVHIISSRVIYYCLLCLCIIIRTTRRVFRIRSRNNAPNYFTAVIAIVLLFLNIFTGGEIN